MITLGSDLATRLRLAAVLVVIFAPVEMARESLAKRLSETVERIARLTGAQPVGPMGSVDRR